MVTRNQTTESARFFFSDAESVMNPRYLTTGSARFFFSDAESVLATRHQTMDITKFFISDAESVMDTRHQTTESANFFFSVVFRENTLVKTLQNGTGNDRKIAKYVKKKIVITGTIQYFDCGSDSCYRRIV